MRTRWALLLSVGGLCGSARAGIQLEELSGQYVQGTHFTVFWQHMDPNDPQSPLGPDITIVQDIDGVPFWFHCYDEATGDPADIYGIGTGPYLYGIVQVNVLAEDGAGFGARNVGKLVCPGGESLDVMFSAFNISGTLATLGVESQVGLISGPFSVVELGDPLDVGVAIFGGGALIVTGAGQHYADITVKSVDASSLVDDEIQIAGDYLGTLTLGTVG